MRFTQLAIRVSKETWRDPIWLGLAIGLPIGMLVVFRGIPDDWFTATNLAPGMAVYGFSVLSFSLGMISSRDRESALLARLLVAPLRPVDFVVAYSVPFLVLGIVQIVLLFGIGAALGLDVVGSFGLVLAILLVTSVFFVGLGMVFGALFSSTQVGVLFAPLSLIVAFSGAWFDLDAMGGVIRTVMNYFPVSHALDATRDVMVYGAGFSEVDTDIYWVVGYTVVIIPMGILLFKRRMIE